MIASIDLFISVILYGFSLSFTQSEGLLSLKEFYLYMTVISLMYSVVDIFFPEKVRFMQDTSKKEIFRNDVVKGLIGGGVCIVALIVMGIVFPKEIHSLNLRQETIIANVFLIVPAENHVFFAAIPDTLTYAFKRYFPNDFKDIRSGSYIFSAILFGMYHLVMSSFNVIYVTYGIVAGVIFVIVRERWSLWAARLGHTANNVLFYLLFV